MTRARLRMAPIVLKPGRPGTVRRNVSLCRRTGCTVGEPGRKRLGRQRSYSMKQMDDNIGYVLKKLEEVGQLSNTIVAFATDECAEVITFPNGGTTLCKGEISPGWKVA